MFSLIDGLIDNKKKFMSELSEVEKKTEHLKNILSTEQVAKFLILTEKVSKLCNHKAKSHLFTHL